jgi:hypothetical protein
MRAFRHAAVADVPSMRLALGIVAIAWLLPIAALAENSPTSPDVPADECGPSEPEVLEAPQVREVHEVKGPLEARIARLEAQLAALEATSEAALTAASSAEAARDPMFRLYGFIDMGLQKFWATDNPVIPTLKTTFVLGNVNLYFDFHPASDWSSLVEVRLTNYPTGAATYGIPALGLRYNRLNTTIPDPGNGEGYDTLRWGAIVLERAYIQWQRNPKLGLRLGQFLTPYGIWNVDHGTPTLISLVRPYFQANEMFPEHQLGAEAFGRFDEVPFEDWQVDYHAYISNGRTPGVVALTHDKMVGGRLVVSTHRPHAMAFGISAIRGRYVDQEVNVDPQTGETDRPTTVSYDEVAVGVDASVDLGGLRLRGEVALRNKRYLAGHREISWAPGVYTADGNEADTYVLAAYRIARTRFEPYLYGEWYRWPTPLGQDSLTGSGGLNVYFTPAVQLKLQFSVFQRFNGRDPRLSSYDTRAEILASKLVMGF